MKTKFYAAYGSNINIQQMAGRCPEATICNNGFINGYKLTFRSGGFANIEKSENCRVPVVLWKITERCERNLDRYEGYPGFYKKTELPVELEAGTQTAMVYVMNDAAKGKFRLPAEYYYYGIKDGYEDNGLPLDYLEKALEECKDEVVKGGNYNG